MSALGQNVVVVPVSALGLVFRQGRVGHADREGLAPDVALPTYLDVELRRQCVDDGCADAVQPAGDGVTAAAELAAGVQHGVHDLDGGTALGLVDVDRDAAAVVDDAHAAVGQDRDVDRRGIARKRLVDRVVDDLGDEMVQASGTRRADVHTRPLANRLEALENLDLISTISRRLLGLRGFGCHV